MMRRPSWRIIAGVTFLLAQVASVTYARFVPQRFFCWAPYDMHTRFTVDVVLGGRQLSANEVARRYHYHSRGWEPRSIYNLQSMIRQYESTYGRDEHAQVSMRYEINGHPPVLWTWPRP